MYGHIVAGDLGSSTAFFVSALDVFDDIEKAFENRPEIPVVDFPRDSTLQSQVSHALYSLRLTTMDLFDLESRLRNNQELKKEDFGTVIRSGQATKEVINSALQISWTLHNRSDIMLWKRFHQDIEPISDTLDAICDYLLNESVRFERRHISSKIIGHRRVELDVAPFWTLIRKQIKALEADTVFSFEWRQNEVSLALIVLDSYGAAPLQPESCDFLDTQAQVYNE